MNLDVNFVLSTDYDAAVNQLRVLSEARIEDWQKNPHMSPEQYRALADVLAEKQAKRRRDLPKGRPHWTTLPGFWLTFLGTLFGLIGFLVWWFSRS